MTTITKEDLRTVTLENSKKSRLTILNFGAAIYKFSMLNNRGKRIDCVVGPSKPEDYVSQDYISENKCFGATVGRFAGRITNGKFKIADEEFQLFQEEGVHLHGGEIGFQHRIWEIEKVEDGDEPSIILSYFSANGEEGYPGNLKVQAVYTLTEKNEINIKYTAETDQDTIVNITNHTYFNLNGGGSISDHFMQIKASKVLELQENNLPTGNLIKLNENSKDYREKRLVGNRKLDDVFVLDSLKGEMHAQLFSPLSGIKLRVYSNQDALVVYLPKELPKNWNYLAEVDEYFPAVAIEPQNFPDSPNFRNFPSSLLKKGDFYENHIKFRFSVK